MSSRADAGGAANDALATTRVSRARTLAQLLDSALPLPGGYRIGLDPLLGLVPGLGDLAGAAMSGHIVLLAARLGAPASVVARMIGNVAIDTLVGAVPVLGDLFDAAWKSNLRNVALLERWLDEPAGAQRSSALVIGVTLLVLVLLAAGGLLVTIALLKAIVTALR